jgi:hypothetical protein
MLRTGPGCVIGHASECQTAILLDRAESPHFGYAGDSVLGNDVNPACTCASSHARQRRLANSWRGRRARRADR